MTNLLEQRYLNNDGVVLNIAGNLTSKLNAKYNKNVSVQDVLVIIESQFKSIPVAINKGESVKLPYIAKVTINPKRHRYLTKEQIDLIDGCRQKTYDEILLELLEKD